MIFYFYLQGSNMEKLNSSFLMVSCLLLLAAAGNSLYAVKEIVRPAIFRQLRSTGGGHEALNRSAVARAVGNQEVENRCDGLHILADAAAAVQSVRFQAHNREERVACPECHKMYKPGYLVYHRTKMHGVSWIDQVRRNRRN